MLIFKLKLCLDCIFDDYLKTNLDFLLIVSYDENQINIGGTHHV